MSLPQSQLVGAEESAQTGFRVTLVNFEGVLTNSTKVPGSKQGNDFLFRAPPEHVQALTEGSVEAVALENGAVLASLDSLSGLANRRGFDSRLDFEWMKATESGGKVALAMRTSWASGPISLNGRLSTQ